MADILNATIADNGHLILVLADGSTIDAGQTRGIPGPQGERGVGIKGDPGEPGVAGLGVSGTLVQNSIVLGATITAPTGGSRTVQRIEYQTLGDGMWLTYKLGQTGATVGAGDYLLSLPTGVQFNTTANPVYTGTLWAGGCAAMAPYFVPTMGGITIPGWWSNMIMVVPYDATRFRLALTGNGDQSKYVFWSTSFYATNSDISLQLQFEIWR